MIYRFVIIMTENKNNSSKKRILYVLHYSGGIEHAVKDMANSVSDEYDFFILKSDMNRLILSQLNGNEFIDLEELELTTPWHAKLIHSEEFKEKYTYILLNYKIDIIQIDHLLFHSLDLPDVANSLNIPTILAFHDYYYICPVIVLLDENYNYCGGYCNNDKKKCGSNIEWFDLPENIVEWKQEWQKEMKKLFEKFDAIITAMPFTKKMYLKHYPSLKESDIQIVQYGRDIKRYYNLNSLPDLNHPIKILIPGAFFPHKGSLFIKELKKIDVKNKLELHLLGFASDELKEIGITYGEYKREDFAKYVEEIKPTFMGLFSIWPETYSHTLTESISVGVPIIASEIGASNGRVTDNDCGWLVDTNNVEKAYQKILEISNDKKEYLRVKKQIDTLQLRTASQMAYDYKKLYEKLLEQKTGCKNPNKL